ncbi:MAG: tetratricopeptide repeat protein [Kiritimatiellaeota bacterium]|nr:tetratricopeptide repeat protein [Kiritimatiellota bacterium]
MNRNWLHWFIPALLVSVLFFGCGRRPGEKLYYEALDQWKAGNHVRARALLEKSIRRRTGSSENADAYNRLGLLLWEMGEIESSADAFTESVRVDASQYPALCNLGVALSAKKDFAGAERAFREAALLQPDDPRPLAYAGIVYVQNQKWDDAARNLRRALSRTPNDPQLQTALALTELQTQGAPAALQRLQAIAKSRPDYAPALFNLAAIYRYNLDRPTEAKAWFERYLDHSSGVDAFSAFARAQLQALNEPVKTPTLSYTPPKVRNRKAAEQAFKKAVALHRAGKTTQAIQGYIRTIEADDTYERAFYNLGLAYYADGQMTAAAESFARAVKLNPAYVDARYNLALVNHYHLGRTPQALRDLETVLSQKPDYQPAIDLIDRIRK